jgi:predicted nucleic acid-binding protein
MPEARVRNWVDLQDNAALYFSVVSVGELRRGFTLLSRGKQRTRLEQWFEEYLLPLFDDRILPVTQSIGERWGILDAECQLRGAHLNTADGLIAATALEHNLTVVTRNVKAFTGLGAVLLNPWDQA